MLFAHTKAILESPTIVILISTAEEAEARRMK
jgi:hypothetical protein